MSYYYASANGEWNGPHTLPELSRLKQAGTLSASTQILTQGEQGWRPLGELLASPPASAGAQQNFVSTAPMFDHAVLVLQLSKKAISASRTGVLQGLTEQSAAEMRQLGREGWELVSVLPFSTGGVGLFSSAAPATDAVLAFFKRVCS